MLLLSLHDYISIHHCLFSLTLHPQLALITYSPPPRYCSFPALTPSACFRCMTSCVWFYFSLLWAGFSESISIMAFRTSNCKPL